MQSKKWVTILSVATLCVFGTSNTDATDVSRKAAPGVEDNRYTLQKKAMLLDSAKITILFVDDTSLLLAGADTKNITPGQTLISSEGNGFLRKVTSVRQTPKGLLVQTTQGSLSEAFETLQFKLN